MTNHEIETIADQQGQSRFHGETWDEFRQRVLKLRAIREKSADTTVWRRPNPEGFSRPRAYIREWLF